MKTTTSMVLLLLAPVPLIACDAKFTVPTEAKDECISKMHLREWPVAEGNGIHPEHLVLDASVQVNEPRLDSFSTLINLIPTRHNSRNAVYEDGAIFYRGNGRIGNVVFHNSFIMGYPICAFSCEGKYFLISQFPHQVTSKNEKNKITYSFFLYVLNEGCLREVVCNRRSGYGLGPEPFLPRSLYVDRVNSFLVDKTLWLDVVRKLRFADSRLNFFAMAWYYHVADTCATTPENHEEAHRLEMARESDVERRKSGEFLGLKELDQTYAIQVMTHLVEDIENEIDNHPATFTVDVTQLMSEGFLVSPEGTPKIPSVSVFKYFVNHDGLVDRKNAQIQALRERLRSCWISLSAKAEKGDITMSPALMEMYRERIRYLNGDFTSNAARE